MDMDIVEQTVELLDTVADLRVRLATAAEQRDRDLLDLMTVEQAQRAEDIRAAYAAVEEVVNDLAAESERRIKALVEHHGKSIKSERMMAVYVGPKPRWDIDGLVRLAVTDPKLAAFRLEDSKPSVSIRKVTGK